MTCSCRSGGRTLKNDPRCPVLQASPGIGTRTSTGTHSGGEEWWCAGASSRSNSTRTRAPAQLQYEDCRRDSYSYSYWLTTISPDCDENVTTQNSRGCTTGYQTAKYGVHVTLSSRYVQ
eukprot:scaffold98543_cov20-Prasinocladus_malaysianus.AAC.1